MAVYCMAAYRNKTPVRRSGRHARRVRASVSPAWNWLMMGILIGILGVFAIYLCTTDKDTLKQWLSAKQPKIKTLAKNIATKPPTKVAQKKAPKERFEFYQLLPGMEVPIPDTDHDGLKPKISAEKPTTPQTQTKLAAAQYLIQAGTFRGLTQAESLKRRLTQQGMAARIQKIEAEDGFWFRVTVGPFASESMAITHKNRLAKQKIQGILILQRQ